MKISSIDKLLQRKMERKEFLLYIGLFLLALTGTSNFLKTINETINKDTKTSHPQSFGYGPYGGLQKGENKLNG